MGLTDTKKYALNRKRSPLTFDQLKKMLDESSEKGIYTFVEFLNALGFDLSVKVKE